jgi:glycerol-3-phosphate dehydrogenase
MVLCADGLNEPPESQAVGRMRQTLRGFFLSFRNQIRRPRSNIHAAPPIAATGRSSHWLDLTDSISTVNRNDALWAVREAHEPWDVLVIGGGATGLGTAFDAASRGYRTVLLEQHDFAKATSSRSTKLIHGGVRYLRQGNVHLVRESLRERGLLLQNAPHLVRKLPFVVPAYAWSDKPFYGIGLKLYDALAGSLGLGPTQWLSREETVERVPGVNRAGLRGGVLYWDAQFDDARLALALAQGVFEQGGVAANYVRVESLLKTSGGRVCGVVARDAESSGTFEVKARVVINATGVFTDTVRRLDDTNSPAMIAASQGAHIMIPRGFLLIDSALMIPNTADGRVLFAIPWHGQMVVGTTDTPVTETPLEPRPLAAEVDFLLEHVAKHLVTTPSREDVLSTWAGLRPLAKSGSATATSKLARDHVIAVSASGLVTIAGGKWTTYRKMAEDAVRKAADVGGLAKRACRTTELKLPAGGLHSTPPELSQHLLEAPQSVKPLIEHCVRHEMARTVEDVLARRTRCLMLDALRAIALAPAVARALAIELGRDAQWEAEQVRSFSEMAKSYLVR